MLILTHQAHDAVVTDAEKLFDKPFDRFGLPLLSDYSIVQT